MRSRLTNIALAGAMLLFVPLIIPAPMSAQLSKLSEAGKVTASKGANALRDLSGVWQGRGVARESGHVFTKEPLPMQPWAEQRYNYNKGPHDPLGHGRNELYPQVACNAPPGPTYILTPQDPFEIIQIPGRIIMLYEFDHWWRDIWMDTQHPKDLKPTWMGHSVGRWDGDTLVIDTVGIREGTWLDSAGHVHSDALHVVERIRRIERDTLRDDLTFDDPKAYTRPFTGQYFFRLRPGAEIEENSRCPEFWQELPPTL